MQAAVASRILPAPPDETIAAGTSSSFAMRAPTACCRSIKGTKYFDASDHRFARLRHEKRSSECRVGAGRVDQRPDAELAIDLAVQRRKLGCVSPPRKKRRGKRTERRVRLFSIVLER